MSETYTCGLTQEERDHLTWIAFSEPAYMTDAEWDTWLSASMSLREVLDRMIPTGNGRQYE